MNFSCLGRALSDALHFAEPLLQPLVRRMASPGNPPVVRQAARVIVATVVGKSYGIDPSAERKAFLAELKRWRLPERTNGLAEQFGDFKDDLVLHGLFGLGIGALFAAGFKHDLSISIDATLNRFFS